MFSSLRETRMYSESKHKIIFRVNYVAISLSIARFTSQGNIICTIKWELDKPIGLTVDQGNFWSINFYLKGCN